MLRNIVVSRCIIQEVNNTKVLYIHLILSKHLGVKSGPIALVVVILNPCSLSIVTATTPGCH